MIENAIAVNVDDGWRAPVEAVEMQLVFPREAGHRTNHLPFVDLWSSTAAAGKT
jgi:hypothetical protein